MFAVTVGYQKKKNVVHPADPSFTLLLRLDFADQVKSQLPESKPNPAIFLLSTRAPSDQ